MTTRISQLGDISTVQGNVLVPLVSNITGNLTTVKGSVDTLKAFIVAATEANIVTANIGIKGYVDSVTTAWTANAGQQLSDLGNLYANASSQQSTLNSLLANAGSQSDLIIGINANVAAANLGMIGYVDNKVSTANIGIIGFIGLGNTIQSQQITTANLGMIGYVDNKVSTANIGVIGYIDQGNTIQSNQISAANLGMKGYVDSVASQSIYGNGNVTSYTVSMGFTNYSNVNVSALITTNGLTNYSNVNAKAYSESMGYQNYGNVNVAALITTNGLTNYSNVNTKAYTESMGFTNYSNVNVSALITTNGLTNYSNVNVIAYLAGNITVGNIAGSVNGFSIGYRDVPQITVANLTLIASDAGKHYYGANTNPTTITIPLNSSVAFGNGTAISLVNQGTGNITISPTGGVLLYLAGNTTAGSKTLTSYGMATLLKVQVNTWFINGTGVV